MERLGKDEENNEDDGLTGGQIFGIVFGCLVVVIIIIVIVAVVAFLLLKKKKSTYADF